jgi:hypothetical protein
VRVAGIEEFGGGVTVLEVPDPRAPRTGEVLIEVKAAGVGNWDEFARTGRWDLGRAPPMALGVAAAGVVAALGAGVEGWSVGDSVFTHPLPLAEQGCWAPWLVAEAALLASKPAELSWPHAASFPVPALTAVQVLDEGLRVNHGERLLVNGAGGATGALIVSMAALRGVEVIATAGPRSRDPPESERGIEVVSLYGHRAACGSGLWIIGSGLASPGCARTSHRRAATHIESSASGPKRNRDRRSACCQRWDRLSLWRHAWRNRISTCDDSAWLGPGDIHEHSLTSAGEERTTKPSCRRHNRRPVRSSGERVAATTGLEWAFA